MTQEREKVAAWMLANSFATGHGDTIEDLLVELGGQVAARVKKLDAERDKLILAVAEHVTVRGQYFKRATEAEAQVAALRKALDDLEARSISGGIAHDIIFKLRAALSQPASTGDGR